MRTIKFARRPFPQRGRPPFDQGKLFAQTGVLALADHHAMRRREGVLTLRREAVDLAFEVKKLAGQRAAPPDASGAQFCEMPANVAEKRLPDPLSRQPSPPRRGAKPLDDPGERAESLTSETRFA
jgi:hypothetical protein